jgi:hypothetical protein
MMVAETVFETLDHNSILTRLFAWKYSIENLIPANHGMYRYVNLST